MTKETKKTEAEVTSTEVVAAQSTEVAHAPEVNMSEWGDVQVTSTDLRPPKLLLMQGTSEMVSQGKAMVGQIIDQSTGERVADYNSKIKVLPFYCRKEYVVSKKKEGAWKFDHTDEVKGEFTRPYEQVINGDEFKNEKQYTFFILLEGGGMPVVVSFKGKSFKTGQQLFTKMYVQNRSQNLPPANNWITLSSKAEKNDKGPYAVWLIGIDAQATKEQLGDCLTWIRTITTHKVVIEEEKDDSNANYANDTNAVF